MKLIVNQAYENMGLSSSQILGPILDGLMRNTPDAIDFIRRGLSKKACARRSSRATVLSTTTARRLRTKGPIPITLLESDT